MRRQRPRDLGALLSAAFDLYGRFFPVFLGIAILVVVPTDIVFYGILGGQLGGYDANPDDISLSIAALGSAFIANPLITAMHVRAVERVGKGQRPTLGETAREGFAVFGALFFAAALAIRCDLYVGMFDPQLLGQMLMLAGLLALLSRPDRLGVVLAAALVVAWVALLGVEMLQRGLAA